MKQWGSDGGWWDDESGAVGAKRIKQEHHMVTQEIQKLERKAGRIGLLDVEQEQLEKLRIQAKTLQAQAVAGDFSRSGKPRAPDRSPDLPEPVARCRHPRGLRSTLIPVRLEMEPLSDAQGSPNGPSSDGELTDETSS